MDPAIVAAAAAGLAGAGAAMWFRRRARLAEAVVADLRRKVLAERIAARQDSLTGLLNRRAFYELGAVILADPTRRPLAAVMLDIDGFARTNEKYGQIVADEVLVAIGRRLADYAGGNLVARLGGDEFVALFTATTARGAPYPDADEISRLLGAPIWVSGRVVRVTVSVGVTGVDRTADLSRALRRAEAVMRRVKILQRRSARAHSFPAARLAEQPALATQEIHAGAGHPATGPVYCRSRVASRRRRRTG
ncbi:MAG: GGDEF domain-containing protein [Hamadaea sp.]|nr:GGDEF domain-containing protein [Hamadaea sp.]